MKSCGRNFCVKYLAHNGWKEFVVGNVLHFGYRDFSSFLEEGLVVPVSIDAA